MSIEQLHARVWEGVSVLTQVQKAVAGLQIVIDERTATTVPLVLGSFDMADAIFTLLIKRHDRAWVPCLSLQRSQIEYVMRAAFFAKAASSRELERFRVSGDMPRRGKRTIYLAEVAEVAAEHLGWDKDQLLPMVRAHQRDLSSVVHGGREVLGIYTMKDEWGDIEVDWSELIGHVDNIVVFLMLGLGVAATHTPLRGQELDAVLRPAYDAGHAYIGQ